MLKRILARIVRIFAGPPPTRPRKVPAPPAPGARTQAGPPPTQPR